MLLERFQSICRAAVKAAYSVEPKVLTVEFPESFGDLALNCFYLAKDLRLAPPAIAAALAAELARDPLVEKAEAVKGFVNVILNRAELFRETVAPALRGESVYGDAPPAADAPLVMVEFSSPNTNKPLHLGHVRNICLGDSIARVIEAAGSRVVRVNLVNDRGIHICKSMLAYQREGGGADPRAAGKKGDHFVGDWYVRYETLLREEFAAWKAEHPEDRDLDREKYLEKSRIARDAQSMLQAWEAGDADTLELWRRMNDWVLAGFEETYAALGVRFDRTYFESRTYGLGKSIIESGLAAGVFQRREDGAVEIDLTAEKLDRKVVLRRDGTAVYITQDIGTTVMKADEFGASGQIFVVGDEQIHHFKVLFAILRRLGYAWADGLFHLAYGMVNLPEGKMKSREGTVVDADDLIAEVTALARAEIESRQGGAEDVDDRARSIGLAALKFMILAVSPQTTMVYDPKASVSFDGDTGPYVLYAYARIRRMVEDAGIDEGDVAFEAEKLGDASEVRLALNLARFPRVVELAARDRNPSLVANWLLDVAHAYHSHNRAVTILKVEDAALRRARLALSRATAQAIRRGLALLGVGTVERM